MLFVETRVFTRRVTELIPDESYRRLQLELTRSPKSGSVIRRSGGLRKIRWSPAGRGKRGGVRIIYYHHSVSETILMLFVFAKNERSDLTARQLNLLRALIEGEYP